MADNINPLDEFAAKFGLTNAAPKPAAKAVNVPKPIDDVELFGRSLTMDTKLKAQTLQDKNEYGTVFSYDNSPTGAFKARYKGFGQETYNKIGFDPLLNNEQIYNQNTSGWDDAKRWLTNSAAPMFGLGVMDPLNSYKSALSGDIGASTEAAKDYEYYNMLGYSTRGGVAGFGVNMLNSVSYSAGILFEGAVEGAVIGGVVGLAEGGVGAVPGAALGGIFGGVKSLLKVPSTLYKTAKAMGKIGTAVKTLKNVNTAKTFWNATKAGGVSALKGLNPLDNTLQAVTSLSKWRDVENLSGLAMSARTGGAFWHDMMGINLALSEGRLEGGFTEQNVYNKLYDDYYAAHGKIPSNEEELKMKQQAKDAGFTNTMWNTALVAYTNKIAFPSITKAGFLKGMPKLGNKIVGTAGKGEFNLALNRTKNGIGTTMSAEKVTFGNALKGLASPKKLGSRALNYFKGNLMEGVQEVSQEALASAVEEHYINNFYNPAVTGFTYSMAALANGIDKQKNGQGLETFASGFLMGSLLDGPSKIVKYGAKGYKKIFSKKDVYDDYIQKREGEAKRIVDGFNGLVGNAKFMFDPRIANYGVTVDLAKSNDNPEASSTKKIKDDEFFAFSSQVLTALRTGTFDSFIENLGEYKNASPEELEEAWELEKGQGEKVKQNLDKAISSAKTMKNRFEYASNKMRPKVNINKLEKDSEEYKKAELALLAHQESVASFVLLQSTFDNTLERVSKLSNTLAGSKVLGGSPFSNFSVLTEADKLEREIAMLKTDLESLNDVNDPSAIKDQAQKRELLGALYKFKEAQDAITQTLIIQEQLPQTKNEKGETIELDLITDLKENGELDLHKDYADSFSAVLNAIAGTEENKAALENEFQQMGGFDSLYTDLFETHILRHEGNQLAKYVNFLSNPEEFNEHVERNYAWMKKMFDNRKEYYKELVNKEFTDSERNEVLNELASKGIYVDLDKFAEWVQNPNKIPDEFIDVPKNMVINQDSVLYEDYARLFARAAQVIEKSPAGDPATEKQKLDDRLADLNKARTEKLNQVREQYEQAFFDTNQKSVSDVTTANTQAEQKNKQLAEEKAQAATSIEALTDTLEALTGTNPGKINIAVEKLLEDGVISAGIVDDIIEEWSDNASDEDVQMMLAIKQSFDENDLPGNVLGMVTFYKSLLPQIIEDRINELKPVLDEQEAEVFDIENTQEYKVYQERVAQINTEYDKEEAEVKQEFKAKGIDENTFDEISVDTPFNEMPVELQKELTEAFNKFLTSIGEDASLADVKPTDYTDFRDNWINPNGKEIISKYNDKIKAENKERAEQLTKPPFLKSQKKQVKAEDTTFALNQLYKLMKKAYDSGVNSKTGEKLTADEKKIIQEDLDNLAGYLEARIKAYKPASVAEKVVKTVQQKIVDRRAEVEDVFDEEGNKIGRRFVGKETTPAVDADIEKRRQELTTFTYKRTFIKGVAHEVQIAKKFNQEGFDVDVSNKADNSTGFLYSNVLSEHFDTIEEAIEYANQIIQGDKEYIKKVDTELAALDEGKTNTGKPERASEIAQAIARTVSGKKPSYNVKAKIVKIFEKHLADNTKDPVSSFMAELKMLSKTNFRQFNATKKLDIIEEGLRKDPTLETLDKLIDKVAFSESSEAGTKVDELIRKFLTTNAATGSGFTEIGYNDTVNILGEDEKVSDFMSKEAYDNLFGAGGIISSVRAQIIDGKYMVFAENLTVFDDRLNENGITGEIDLLAVDAEGNVMIIDIKTAKSWDTFEEPDNFKKISYSAQLSIYGNLFYNMTGIEVSELNLLPLQIDVDVTGYIHGIKKAEVNSKDDRGNKVTRPLAKGYYPLEYMPEVEDAGVVKIAPVLTEEEKEENQKQQGTEQTNNIPGQIEQTDLKELTLSKQVGKTVIFQGKAATLIVLEDGTYAIEKTTNRDIEVLTRTLDSLRDDLNEEIDEDGNLTEFGSQEIVSQIKTSIARIEDQIEKGDQSKEVQALYYKGKPAKNGDLNITELGISPVTEISSLFEMSTIDNEIVKARFDNETETIATINGVRHDVVRDKTGAIVALSYMSNGKKISDIESDTRVLAREVNRLRENLKNLPKENGSDLRYLVARIDQLESEIKKLNTQRDNLRETNELVFVKGGNANNYIFALNVLPNSFQKLVKKLQAKDEQKHLDAINKKSVASEAINKAITEIMERQYPAAVDKLLFEGVKAVDLKDLLNIQLWIEASIADLEDLGFRVINSNELVDDIQANINVLQQLQNDLNLIKLNKDGKISKQQKSANEIFGERGSVQKRTSVPKNEKPTGGQTEGVSGQPAGRVSQEELQQIINDARKETLQLKVEEVQSETPTTKNAIIKEFVNAKTLKDLEKAYIKVLTSLGKYKTDIKQAKEQYEARKKELATDVSFDNLEVGKEHLISKIPIFDEANAIVLVESISNGRAKVKNIKTGETGIFTESGLAGTFNKINDEAMENMNQPVVTQDDVELSKESHESFENFSKNNEKISELETEADAENDDDIFNKLKDNSKYCK